MLNSENTVLVLVDIQGKLATLMYERDAFFKNVGRMIKGANILGIPIIWNEQLPDKLGKTVQQIAELLADQSPLVKNTFSCCGNPDFIDKLKSLGRKQVLLVGMETHVCVYQSAIDFIPLGYEVHLVADAVSSRTLENKQIGIQAIKDLGAKITSVETAFFELLRVAEGDKFKKIIQLIK